MKATSDIESDIEDLKEDVLPGLPSDERARAVVQFRAADQADVVEALYETAPTKSYEATDLDFRAALREYTTEALYALWELETGVWRFLYERVSGQLRAANYDRYPDAEWTEEPAPENGFHERAAGEAAAEFLADYRAWERYAIVDVGVTLSEFLRFPLEEAGAHRVELVEQIADLVTGDIDGIEGEDGVGWAESTGVTVDGEECDVDTLAEWKYEQITAERGEA